MYEKGREQQLLFSPCFRPLFHFAIQEDAK